MQHPATDPTDSVAQNRQRLLARFRARAQAPKSPDRERRPQARAGARQSPAQEARRGSLDNKGATLPAAPSESLPEDLFGSSYGLLHELRTLAGAAGLQSVQACGLAALPDAWATILRRPSEAGAAGLTGVRRCASPWACPVCGPRIGMRRATELLPQLRDHEARGWET